MLKILGVGGWSQHGSLLENTIYAILIYQWRTNTTIKVAKEAKRSQRNKTYKSLEREKGKKQRVKSVSPSAVYQLALRFPLSTLLTPIFHSLFHFAKIPPHPAKTHTRATETQVPEASRRDIPRPGSAPPSPPRLPPAAPAYSEGDKTAAVCFPLHHPRSQLLPECFLYRQCQQDLGF